MPKYIFLDTWVLDKYTKAGKAHLLANFLTRNGYTVMYNGLSMTEVYNPGWANRGAEEEGARVARFLGGQHCVVVRPDDVWQAEFVKFPRQLTDPPVRLDLDNLPAAHREPALLAVLRRDPALVNEGIDIAKWKADYDTLRKSWATDVQNIIQDGVQHGELKPGRKGCYVAVDAEKREWFLYRLDMRHYQDIPAALLSVSRKKMADYKGKSSIMRAVRLSTLYLWHHYIAPDPRRLPKKAPSDLGDFVHMSVLPYCDTFTIDTNMAETVKRAMAEVRCSCRILTYRELDEELSGAAGG